MVCRKGWETEQSSSSICVSRGIEITQPCFSAPTSVRLRALRYNGVVERLQSSNNLDVLVGHVLLLGRILAEVE